jgi:hypothetical protein
MKVLGLVALALMMSIGASAAQLAPIYCGGFSFAGTGPGGVINTSNPVTSGTITCAPFTAGLLPAGDNFVSEQLLLQADYSSGTGNNSDATTYSAGTLAMVTDTITAAGPSGPATSWADSFGAGDQNPTPPGFGSSYFLDDSYTQTTLPTAGGTIAYSVNLAAGSTIQSVSGNVYELINYTTTAPEPATLGLVGSALLGLGLLARKRVSR